MTKSPFPQPSNSTISLGLVLECAIAFPPISMEGSIWGSNCAISLSSQEEIRWSILVWLGIIKNCQTIKQTIWPVRNRLKSTIEIGVGPLESILGSNDISIAVIPPPEFLTCRIFQTARFLRFSLSANIGQRIGKNFKNRQFIRHFCGCYSQLIKCELKRRCWNGGRWPDGSACIVI